MLYKKQSTAMQEPHDQLLACMRDPLSILLNQENTMARKAHDSASGLVTARNTRRRTRYATLQFIAVYWLISGTAPRIKSSWKKHSNGIRNLRRRLGHNWPNAFLWERRR